MSMDLSGKVALVTGGSRGLGRAVALALAGAGVDVAVNYREQRAAAEEVVAAVRQLGRRALAVGADVAVPDEVTGMAVQVERELGTVGILVNNAGVARVRKVDQLDLALFDEAINVNLRSSFLVTQAVLPAMRRARWGRLIFMSSIAANIGGVVGPHYAASKAGMLGLMHGYASQLVKEGITSNAISPALIDTDMVRAGLNVTPERIPVGRFGHVDEVADAVLMVARNAYLTGQALHLNGGMYLTS